jgi:hypothetical protein
MADKRTYPAAMYHKNEQYPIMVDNRADEEALAAQGWTRAYIHKEYPKWVNGVIVKNKEEHDALLAQPQIKVALGPLPEEQGSESMGRRGRKAE